MLLLAITFGCDKKLDNYSIEYSGDKLVVFGKISNIDGVYIELTHSLPPTGEFYFDSVNLKVGGATVVLFENGLPVDTLDEIDVGIYSGTYPAISGNQYSIHCNATGYDSVFSSSVSFPQEGFTGTIQYEPGLTDINGDPAIRLTPVFSDDPSNANYYFFGFTSFDGASPVPNDAIYEFPDSDPFDCGPYRFAIRQVDYRIFTDNCFSGLNFPFGFEASGVYYSDTIHHFSSIRMIVGNASKEYYDYALSTFEIGGFDLVFTDPKITYSNILNGYGVFWAENGSAFTYSF